MKKGQILPNPHFVVDEAGEKTQVLLDIKEYNYLVDCIEDLLLGKMAENILATASEEDWINFEDIKDSLLKD